MQGWGGNGDLAEREDDPLAQCAGGGGDGVEHEGAGEGAVKSEDHDTMMTALNTHCARSCRHLGHSCRHLLKGCTPAGGHGYAMNARSAPRGCDLEVLDARCLCATKAREHLSNLYFREYSFIHSANYETRRANMNPHQRLRHRGGGGALMGVADS